MALTGDAAASAPKPEAALDKIDALVARLCERGVGMDETINPFWRRQLAAFKTAFERDRCLSVKASFCLGYWEEQLPTGARNKGLPSWIEALAAAKSGDVKGLDRAQLEHAGALAVLDRRGVLKSYRATLDRLGIVSRMTIARQYYQLSRLTNVRTEPGHILEIGAGGGHFARLAVDAGLVRHYVIVDLPEMLLNSCATIAQRVRDAAIHLNEAPDLAADGLHFWFLEPGEIARTPDRAFDVALNFNSFMEMDDQVRDRYIAEIYRACRPGAVFYNVNRMQRGMTRRDGSKFDNNPLLYPYRTTDRVLEWEPDDMQQSQRALRFDSPHTSFAISRIALIA